MTYTFKLARRLAVLPNYAMIASLMLMAACAADEGVSPEASDVDWRDRTAIVTIAPEVITVETNQDARFTGRVHMEHGDTLDDPLEWAVDGGTITVDGLFRSAKPGTFKVIGRGRNKADTAIVTVVPPQPTLASLTIAPGAVSLVAGATQQFTAKGLLSDGAEVAVGSQWTATGGTVDAAGVYTAGTTAGTYRVVVANTEGTIADTATVTVTVPQAPPAPTLTQVFMTPASASLLTGGTQQFAAYGRMSNGDSVALSVTFSATGGTITSNGLYTAGSTAGSYRVIAKASSGPADTSIITSATPPVTVPVTSPVTGAMGIPFGTFDLVKATGDIETFTLGHDSYQPSTIVARIAAARTSGRRILMAMTGGSHSNYLTNGVFDPAKWGARLALFNTSAIRAAIAEGVADGTILGASVMDEPQVYGLGDGNTWGPKGTMTKVRVDSLCRAVKAVFPTLPAGVVHRHDAFEPTNSYRTCEFIVSQYSTRFGTAASFRDAALALAKRDGINIVFSMNILNGGTQDKDGTWDCVGMPGKGTYAPNCWMSPEQVRDAGYTLGPAGCGLLMWRYDENFMAQPGNQQAFRDVATRLRNSPRKSCGK